MEHMKTKERSYTYLRYMRDGSVEERHGVSNNPKRVRNGKTARESRHPSSV